MIRPVTRDISPVSSSIEANRRQLRSVFSKHQPNKEGKLPFSELLKFCKNSRIHPDLVLLNELKRILESVLRTPFSAKTMISYAEFERFLCEVASQSFGEAIPQETKARMLLLQAKPHVESHYAVVFNTERSSATSRLSATARQPSLRKTIGDSQVRSSRDLQIDMNISAALQVLKKPAAKTGQNTGNETDRASSPSRIVRNSKRNPSYSSLAEMISNTDRSLSCINTVDSFMGDSPVKVRLKTLTRSNRYSLTEPQTKPSKDTGLQYRKFIAKQRNSAFSSDFVIKLIIQTWRMAAQLKLLSEQYPDIY